MKILPYKKLNNTMTNICIIGFLARLYAYKHSLANVLPWIFESNF